MFFKSPNPDISGVAVHGKQFDVVSGFIEIVEEELTAEIEATLKSLGFALAPDEEVATAVTEVGVNKALKNEAAERAAILAEIKAWGLRVDGRKGLAWIKERFEEFVAQGHIKPGETPPGAEPAPAVPEPILPLRGGAAAELLTPKQVFEDDPAAQTDGAEATGEAEPAAV